MDNQKSIQEAQHTIVAGDGRTHLWPNRTDKSPHETHSNLDFTILFIVICSPLRPLWLHSINIYIYTVIQLVRECLFVICRPDNDDWVKEQPSNVCVWCRPVVVIVVDHKGATLRVGRKLNLEGWMGWRILAGSRIVSLVDRSVNWTFECGPN